MDISHFDASALDDLPVATVIYHCKAGVLQICYLNQSALALWGCSRDTAQLKTMEDLFAAVHPLDVPLFAGLEDICHHGGHQISPITFRLLRQGETLWIQMDIRAIANPDATITLYTTMTNVTQGKILEHQLHIKEEEYRIAAEHNSSYIFRYHVINKTLEITLKQEGPWQFPAAIEDVPNSFIQRGFITPESIHRVTAFFTAMQNGQTYGSEQVLCLIKGKQTLFHVQYTLVEDVNGEHTLAIGAFHDISNLKRRKSDHESPEDRQKLFELVATHSRKHIYKYDHKTGLTTSIQSMADTKQTMLPFHSKDMLSYVDKAYRPALKAVHNSMLQRKPTGELEYLVHINGQSCWHKLIFTNVFDDNSDNGYALLSIEDCTEERERAKAYALYQQDKSALSGQASVVEYNITQRKVVSIDAPAVLSATTKTPEEILKTHLENFVLEQDKVKIISFFNFDRMLQAYLDNIRTEELDHGIMLSGQRHWMHTTIRYYQDPYSDDVMALLTTLPSDEQHAQQEAFTQAVERDGSTGLYNYTTFEEKVNDACTRASTQRPGTFILVGFQGEHEQWKQIMFPLLLAHFKKSAKLLKTLFDNDALVGRLENYQMGIYLETVSDAALLQDRLQLVQDLLGYSADGKVLVSPTLATISCLQPTQTLLDLWQTASLATIPDSLLTTPDSALNSAPQHRTPLIPFNHQSRIVIRTFGHFDVYLDGQAIHFKTAKAKELLALLVDRCGGYVDAAEGAMILYEDQPYDERLKSKYRKVVMRLHEILNEYGIEDIIDKRAGSRKLNTHLVNCDYYHHLFGGSGAEALFNGAYLSNYSWGEETLAMLSK